MSTATTTRKRILFVDDELAFLDLLGQAMELYSKGSWEILLATSTSKALSMLQGGPVHLVVVDIHMPVVDGIQFLKLLQRKYPNLPRAVLTGDASENHREACQAIGVEMFLEKPRCPEGLEIVHATLDELANCQPESGFQGVLRRVGIQDVLQMECLARSTVILEIAGQGFTGQIFIENGSIVHSQVGELKGEPAFNHLLGLSGGQFNLKAFTEPPERTISGSWEFLLMEAARMRDEVLGQQAEAAAAEAAAAAQAGPAPEPEAEAAADPAPAPESSNTQLLQRLQAQPSAEFDSTILPAPQAEPTPPAPPQVAEFLITTGRGDVIHEWQCADPADRVKFMEMLNQRSRQVCQGLPVGPTERIELEGLESRWVMRLEAEQTYLLHAIRERPGVQLETLQAC